MAMILIGENLNIMSASIARAMKEMDPAPVRERAIAEAEAGVDMLDINLGPLRKGGPEVMEWVVKTVQEVVDLPLCIDTTSVEAMEAGLRACRGKALINSISARPERMEALMPLARKYGAGFIGIVVGVEGLPRDGNERGCLAAEILAEASRHDIHEDDIWIDPLVLPVTSQQAQVQGCTEFMAMIAEFCRTCKSTCGLSNVSNGVPEALRGLVNRTYLIMLRKYGLYSALVDAFDSELRAIAEGKRPDLEAVVHRVMEDEAIDTTHLSKEEAAYGRTARMLLGRILYSDSWLDY